MDILAKIKEAGLVGRGGAGFSAHIKWQGVKDALGYEKYVICNASEGEIGIFKDRYILKNYPERVFKGLQIAADFIGTKNIYFNFNQNYYNQFHAEVDKLVKEYSQKGYQIVIFKEHPSYPGGEETALLNAMEGKRLQPRLKPPYPTEKGLYGQPTLIHNVETLFNVADVAEGKFEHKRFYSLINSGQVAHLPDDWSIWQIMQEAKIMPHYDFFVQIGGSGSGLILNKNQLKDYQMIGAGSIEIYHSSTHPKDMLFKWFNFYNAQSCGKCTPCREGTYQLYKLVKDHERNKEIPWKKILKIIEVLEETSFCALGRSVAVPVRSYIKNVLKKKCLKKVP